MVESEQSCGSPSSSKGLENARYKLIKNEDKLILTDKKTLKSRVLDIDDIDYVVDDNQKLRDPNITENYFRLKDEPYEPKMSTKTADYVKEQKEADKITGKIQQDIVEQFIKRHKLTDEEIKLLADIPDIESIKKFKNRDLADIKAIINDFKVMRKDLVEDKKIGTDPFNYLMAYFKSYKKLADEKVNKEVVENVLKNPTFYNDNDIKKIKEIPDITIQKIYDSGVKYINNINLTYLQNFINRIKKFMVIFNDSENTKVEIDESEFSVYEPKFLNYIRFQAHPKDMNIWEMRTGKDIEELRGLAIYGVIENWIIIKLITLKIINYMNLKEELNNLVNQGLDYFSTYDKLHMLGELFKENNIGNDMYKFKIQIYKSTPEDHLKFTNPAEYYTNRYFREGKLPDIKYILPGYLNQNGKTLAKSVQMLAKIVMDGIDNDFSRGMASGWTDDTLSRIETIQTILNRYGFGTINPGLLRVMDRNRIKGSGWTDDTLTRIENIQSTLNNFSYGMKSSGWTDDTLSRIEKINTTLSQYI